MMADILRKPLQGDKFLTSLFAAQLECLKYEELNGGVVVLDIYIVLVYMNI